MLNSTRAQGCPEKGISQPGKASARITFGLPSTSRGFLTETEETTQTAAARDVQQEISTLHEVRSRMNADDEKILKVAKEVLVKFIEMGTVSPTNFDEKFRSVYWTVKDTIVSARLTDLETSPSAKEEAPEQ
jgi:hypothetical protein